MMFVVTLANFIKYLFLQREYTKKIVMCIPHCDGWCHLEILFGLG